MLPVLPGHTFTLARLAPAEPTPHHRPLPASATQRAPDYQDPCCPHIRRPIWQHVVPVVLLVKILSRVRLRGSSTKLSGTRRRRPLLPFGRQPPATRSNPPWDTRSPRPSHTGQATQQLHFVGRSPPSSWPHEAQRPPDLVLGPTRPPGRLIQAGAPSDRPSFGKHDIRLIIVAINLRARAPVRRRLHERLVAFASAGPTLSCFAGSTKPRPHFITIQ